MVCWSYEVLDILNQFPDAQIRKGRGNNSEAS